MPKKPDVPLRIHIELAMLALQSAMSGIRFIEENDISLSEFRNIFPAILDELNRATYYLGNLTNRSLPTPVFLNN
jgi:hypothetical protein